MTNLLKVFCAFITVLVLTSCVTTGKQSGNIKDGYRIHGFLGESSTVAAAGTTIQLLDGQTDKILDIFQSNFFGKYSFDGLQPGYYKLLAREITRELLVKNKDVRMDIDFSSPDGSTSYSKKLIQSFIKSLNEQNRANQVNAGSNTASGNYSSGSDAMNQVNEALGEAPAGSISSGDYYTDDPSYDGTVYDRDYNDYYNE